ncbi:MAG TPA: flagellar hook protein FlgE [Pyrinomonadaceae bacterium]|nr:flagellar hook protein FlgE [Pyrinomonadaceae bacterium]
MPFSFSTALSGLRASSNSLGVSGNNIANANTTAFKSSSITFSDIFTNTLGVRMNGAGGTMQVGSGVNTAAIPTNFTQGNLADNASSTAVGIQGSGFFIARDASGAQVYTRAGDFSIDKEGFLVTPNGSQVQGYAAVGLEIPPGGQLTSIRIPIGETTAPVQTTETTLKMNLNATDQTGIAFHAPMQVYDSKGVSHTLDITFTKQADGTYQVAGTLDGHAATIDTGSDPSALVFDAAGALTGPATLRVIPDQTELDGAELPSIDVNLFQTNPDGSQGAGNITNFAAPSGVAAILQDGFAAGSLTGLSMSADHYGTLSAVFSNGQVRPIAQFALATFNSQDGLSRLGGNQFGETAASGQPSIGAAASGGRGLVVGNVLEESNVDLASEFTDLIVAQRSFQANSRVISTISQTLQDLLQNV